MNAINDQGIFERPPRRDSVAVKVGNVTVGAKILQVTFSV